MITLDDCLLTVSSISYDKDHLKTLFEEVKHCGRVRVPPWIKNKTNISLESAKFLSIQYGNILQADPSLSHLSVNLLEFDYINDLLKKFNFENEIQPFDVEFLWYKIGNIVYPHVDGYAQSVLIFPIFPEQGNAPIDFYDREGLEHSHGDHRFNVFDNNIVLTHHYNQCSPTIINSHLIHGVRYVSRDRVCLRIRIPEKFSSIRNKYLQGQLIK